MTLSEDTKTVLNFLDTATDNNLRKRADIGIILEAGAKYNLHSLVNNIIFTGKSIWSIYQIIRKARSSDEIGIMKRELNKSMDEFDSYLKELIQNTEPEDIVRFGDVYFSGTEGSKSNIIDLAHDFAELKKLQNLAKQKHHPE